MSAWYFSSKIPFVDCLNPCMNAGWTCRNVKFVLGHHCSCDHNACFSLASCQAYAITCWSDCSHTHSTCFASGSGWILESLWNTRRCIEDYMEMHPQHGSALNSFALARFFFFFSLCRDKFNARVQPPPALKHYRFNVLKLGVSGPTHELLRI